MIEFNNVSFSYSKKGEDKTIQNMSFKVNDGEFAAIIGENGAGKSTVSKLISGLIKPTDGEVLIDGESTGAILSCELAKKIGFLFQNPDRRICCDSVEKEMGFGLKLRGMSESEISEVINPIIADFGFEADKNPFSLSKGERQRLALASIIAEAPRIIILDEPTTGLDYRECTHIMDIVSQLNKRGTTVIMVCHDMELVLDYAKRLIVMADGKIIADGSAHSVFRNAAALSKASVIPPQIIELGHLLGEAFYEADTVDEAEKLLLEKIV